MVKNSALADEQGQIESVPLFASTPASRCAEYRIHHADAFAWLKSAPPCLWRKA